MKNKLEEFIQSKPDDLDRKKPDPAVLQRVLAEMQQKQNTKPRGVVVSFAALRWAAACVLAITAGIVLWQTRKQPDGIAAIKKPAVTQQAVKQAPNDSVNDASTTAAVHTNIIKHQGIDAVDQELAAREAVVLAGLKEHKMVLFAGIPKMESAAGRIGALDEVSKLKNSGNDVVDALVSILNTDPNTNVRLAALDGLTRFYREDYVRKKLVAAVKNQPDPLVQITLINLLTRMKESRVLTELEKIVHNDNTVKAVKDCAYSGILQLHS